MKPTKSYTIRPDGATIKAFDAFKIRAETTSGIVQFEGKIALLLLQHGLRATGFLKNGRKPTRKEKEAGK